MALQAIAKVYCRLIELSGISSIILTLSTAPNALYYLLLCHAIAVWFCYFYPLFSQGLRTLELCVDNMQPDFLYQHLYQVRGDMLLGLYTSLHSQSEYVQKMAFKVIHC